MGKFCFLCGKKTEKLIENYCEECFGKKFELIKVPKKLEIISCSKCNFIKLRNEWTRKLPEDAIRNKIKILGDNVKIKIKKNNNYQVIASGYPTGSKKIKKEIHEINVHLNKINCPICIRKYGGYYEAILQLRGEYEDDFEFIDNQLRKDKNAFYRTEKVKGGIDLYIGSKKAANKVSGMLRKKGYKVKKTFKLVTKKLGKEIYRTIISARKWKNK